jgi:signal transduction histidine kinase
MSRSSSADASPPGAAPAQRGAGSALAPRNWRVASRLIVLVAIPTLLGLALAGLQVTDATRSAQAYGQVARLAAVGQQVTGLAQAMEDERADTAAFIADGRPAAGLVALHRQYLVTNDWAAAVRRLVRQLGPGYPARTRASEATVLASIAELPGLRRQAAQSQARALDVINAYSGATSGLFAINDGIADLSGDPTLLTSVRALGSLSRMKDQASLQQAVLGVALTEGSFAAGARTALTTAQAQQASDLASFRSSATPEESWALTATLANPLAGQARAVEQHAVAAGPGALALGAQASQQWRAGTSFEVGWMRQAEQQLTAWIITDARSLRQSTMRSAVVTGGVALAVLVVVVLATMIVTRSLVRPLRRLEAAALDVAGSSGHLAPVTPIDVRSTDEIGRVALAFDRAQRETLRLAGEEARRRRSISALSTSFFRRSHSLQERLLRLIDGLEFSEDDPGRLASLFQIDHLATRMRRNSDSALVLAGHEAHRPWAEPVILVDVLRAAVSEIEQYGRVVLDIQSGVSVNGNAVGDTVHLLAELLENATEFSPRTTQVLVSGHLVRGGGSLISIADSGEGMPEEQLRQVNWQLAHPPPADAAADRRMGLFAVAHLAARHGITVTLERPPAGGTTVEVHLPAALMSPAAEPGGWPGRAGELPRARADEAEADEEAWAEEDEEARAEEEAWAEEARPEEEPGAGEGAAAADPWPAFPRFAAGPESPGEPEIARPDAVPLTLGAPLAPPAPATSLTAIAPEPLGAERGGALPIYESVESDYFDTRSRGLLRPSEPHAGQPTLTERPAAATGSRAAADGWRAAEAAATPAVGALTRAGLPQRIPQANLVPGAAVDRAAQTPVAAESAEIAQGRLASFQGGSRRARAVARADRDAGQPAEDG